MSEEFDTIAAIIRSCDSMLRDRTDPIEISMLHEARARASKRMKLYLLRLTDEQLWALCTNKLGASMAIERAAHALASVDIPAAMPANGNIEIVADNDGNGVVEWSPVKAEGPPTT